MPIITLMETEEIAIRESLVARVTNPHMEMYQMGKVREQHLSLLSKLMNNVCQCFKKPKKHKVIRIKA